MYSVEDDRILREIYRVERKQITHYSLLRSNQGSLSREHSNFDHQLDAYFILSSFRKAAASTTECRFAGGSRRSAQYTFVLARVRPNTANRHLLPCPFLSFLLGGKYAVC